MVGCQLVLETNTHHDLRLAGPCSIHFLARRCGSSAFHSGVRHTLLGYHISFFCEAALRLGLDTRAYALDTWQGNDQAGIYGEEVFDSVTAINQSDYSSFSTLLREYFDDSLAAIPDGSIDLLHIDRRHGFDDVTHDFEAWLPKLSHRDVVILHDIVEHQEGFGVWRFWETVKTRYPSFAFEHSHGLGVLGVGPDLPRTMQAF